MKNKIFLTLLVCGVVQASELLTFSKAYDLALKNSKEMQSVKYQEKAMQEKINQEKAALYPQVNLSATVGKNDYTLNHRQSRLDYDVNGDPLNLTLSINQAVYDPELLNKIEMQKTKEKIFRTRVIQQKQELAQRALSIYSDILKSQNRIKLLKATIDYYDSMFQTVENKYKLRLANKMDLLEVQVQYNSAKIELKKEESLQKVNRLRLYNLIGVKKIKLPQVDLDNLDMDLIKEMQRVASKNIKKIDSLKIQEALLNLKLAQEQIQSAYNGHKPKVSLQASYTKYNKDDESAYYEETKTIALRFNLPLYQGGYTQSQIISSKFNEKASQMDLENIKEQVRVEYGKNLAIFNSAIDSINLFKEALASANLYYQSVKEGYDNGLKDKTKLFEAKSKIFDVKFKYMQSLYDMIDSFISLLILSNDFKNLYLIDRVLI